MKRFLTILAAATCWAVSGMASAAITTLKFDANDIFNYATTDDTRLNQQGTARLINDSPTGRYYTTFNDGPYGHGESGATPANDLLSVGYILDSVAVAGYQGVSHVQLWLQGGISTTWGEVILAKPGTVSASVNDEFGWTANVESGIVHFNTVLGGSPAEQNAISPDFNPADELWEVSGDFYVDVNGNSIYDAGDTDLVGGDQYTIWFNAAANNWWTADAYGNGAGGNPDFQGSLRATAVPEPASMAVWGLLGLVVAGRGLWRRKRAV